MGKSATQLFRTRFMASAMALACAAALPACGTASKMTTGSISRQSGKPLDRMSSAELSQASAAYRLSYEKNPKDKQAGLNHANALQDDRAQRSGAGRDAAGRHHPCQ